MSEILSALSFALDLTEGQPMGHSVRTCLLGMRLAEKIQLSPQETVFETMARDVPGAFCPVCFEALQQSVRVNGVL